MKERERKERREERERERERGNFESPSRAQERIRSATSHEWIFREIVGKG